MKSLTESPAVLSVHEGAPGQFILRIADLRYRPLLVGVSKLLPGASSLVVVTPSDIKVFAVGGDNGHAGPDAVDSSGDIDSGVDVQVTPEMQAAIDAESAHSIPGAAIDDSSATEPDVVSESKPRAIRRKKPDSVAGHDEPCGRCRGAGRIPVILDGGGSSDTVCPICQGSGVMKRYGARR